MIVGTQEFPDTLEIHSRIRVTSDPSRLLLTTVQPMGTEAFKNLAYSLGLVPEEEPLGGKTNDSSHHTWVRTPNGQPISESTLDRIVALLGPTLARISPVYQNPRVEGRRGLLCPLPHVLLIKPTTSCNKGEDPGFSENLDEKLLTQYELDHIPERTHYSGEYRYYVLRRGSHKTAYELQRVLLNDEAKLVKEAQFEIMPLFSASASWPNDPKFPPNSKSGDLGQWNLLRIHAFPNRSSLPLPVWHSSPPLASAWSIFNHSIDHEIVVWLIDDGCDPDHDDLQLYSRGKLFRTIDLQLNPPRVPFPIDTGTHIGSHGAMCAGVIAPKTNNETGVAGIASKSCKVFPLAGEVNTDALRAAALYYAAEQTALGAAGVLAKANVYAKVVSWSEGDNSWNPQFIDPAIQAAVNQGIVICVATQDQGGPITYPATNPNVIACGSIDNTDHLYRSNFGPELSVVAPGFNIWTTRAPNSYDQFSATSAATPHVAALAALLLSVQPELTVQQVRNIIELTAEKLRTYSFTTSKPNGAWDDNVGYGLINVHAAMDNVLLQHPPWKIRADF